MKTIKTLLAALMISMFSLNAARAEPKADEPKPAQGATIPGQLTPDSLKEMLTNLGYDFDVEKTTNGNFLHFVKVARKGMNYEVNVNISSNKQKLWCSVALADVKPEHATQSDKLLKLLELNQKIGPSHFYYYPPHKMFYIAKPMDNRGITAKLLRENIDSIMETVVTYETDWNVAKWGVDATASKTDK